MRKSGDEVFIINKYTNTPSNFILMVGKRILTEPVKDQPGYWYCTNAIGDGKPYISENNMYDTKQDAINSILGGIH